MYLPGGGLAVGGAVLQRRLHRQLILRVLLGVPLERLVGGGLQVVLQWLQRRLRGAAAAPVTMCAGRPSRTQASVIDGRW